MDKKVFEELRNKIGSIDAIEGSYWAENLEKRIIDIISKAVPDPIREQMYKALKHLSGVCCDDVMEDAIKAHEEGIDGETILYSAAFRALLREYIEDAYKVGAEALKEENQTLKKLVLEISECEEMEHLFTHRPTWMLWVQKARKEMEKTDEN